jgi:hypothetical protein
VATALNNIRASTATVSSITIRSVAARILMTLA